DAAPFLVSMAGATAKVAAAAAGGKIDCGPAVAGASVGGVAAVLAVGCAEGAEVAAMSRTTPAARSASRPLRSSETLSVGDVRDAFLAAGLGFCGLACALGGGGVSPSVA